MLGIRPNSAPTTPVITRTPDPAVQQRVAQQGHVTNALLNASMARGLGSQATATPSQVSPLSREQLRALNDATAGSVGTAKNAKNLSTTAKSAKAAAESLIKQPYDLSRGAFGKDGVRLEAKDLKLFDWAKSFKSIAGAVASLPLAIADAVSQYRLGRQVAVYSEGAQAFEDSAVRLTDALSAGASATRQVNGSLDALADLDGSPSGDKPEAQSRFETALNTKEAAAQQVDNARRDLYSPAGAERAEAWLKHREASNQSNLLGLGLGAASSVAASTEAGVTTAWEVTYKTTYKAAGAEVAKEAAKSLKSAVPFVGIAGSVVGMATSAHACKKAYGVRQELNAQRADLAAATNSMSAEGNRTGMENALANVFKHAGDTLEIRNNANSMRAVGSVLGVAASGVSLAGNVAAVTGVGIGAAFGLAVASATLSFMGLAATVSASIYEAVKGKGDGNLKTAAAGSPGECADLAATNKFAALVVLANQLQTLPIGSAEFGQAERLLATAGLEPAHVQAIISLARANPGEGININSPAVNELAKAFYGAPVGQVATSAAVPQAANAAPAT